MQMIKSRRLLAVLLVSLSATVFGQDATRLMPIAPDAQATATLPLQQVIDLYRQNDAIKAVHPEAPPVSAAVHRLALQARLLDSAVLATAHFEVVVLAEDQWVSVPLLTVTDATQLRALPEISGSVLTVVGEHLTFITRNAGVYRIEVEFLQQAVSEETRREAKITYPSATTALGVLSYDKDLFAIDGEYRDNTLHPVDGVFTLSWRRLREPQTVDVDREVTPAIESVIPTAHASVVSTLEGTHIIRVLYALRFAGRKPITVSIPDGQRLEHGYLNGVSIPVDPSLRALHLEVSASQAGGEGATLELVLVSTGNQFLLSGELALVLPVASWRVNELFASTHLPRVFDYKWVGGSLSPSNGKPSVAFSYDIPTPGKQAGFRQFLVHTSQPSLSLSYNVSLEGNYYQVESPSD